MAKYVPENWGLTELLPADLQDDTLPVYLTASQANLPGSDPAVPEEWEDHRVNATSLVFSREQFDELAVSFPVFVGSWTDLGISVSAVGRKFAIVSFMVVYEVTKAGMDEEFIGQVRLSVDGTPVDSSVFPIAIRTSSTLYDSRQFTFPWYPVTGTEVITAQITSLLGDGTARCLGADVLGANGNTYLEINQ